MTEATRDYVALHDPDHVVNIFGELIVGVDCCRVSGIATGLNEANYQTFHPAELHGTSEKRGRVWLERIVLEQISNASRSRPKKGAKPTTISAKALNAYWGDFDPRKNLIKRGSLSLNQLQRLSSERLTEHSHEDGTHVSRATTRMVSVELFGSDEYTLSIDYLPSIGDEVTYK